MLDLNDHSGQVPPCGLPYQHSGAHDWQPQEQREAGDSGLQPLWPNLTDHDLRAYRARAYEEAGLIEERMGPMEMPSHAPGCMLKEDAGAFCTRCLVEQSALIKGGYAIEQRLGQEIARLMQKMADLAHMRATVRESLEAYLSHERATLHDLRLKIAALEHIAMPRSNPLWQSVLGAFISQEGDRTETWAPTRMKMAEAL